MGELNRMQFLSPNNNNIPQSTLTHFLISVDDLAGRRKKEVPKDLRQKFIESNILRPTFSKEASIILAKMYEIQHEKKYCPVVTIRSLNRSLDNSITKIRLVEALKELKEKKFVTFGDQAFIIRGFDTPISLTKSGARKVETDISITIENLLNDLDKLEYYKDMVKFYGERIENISKNFELAFTRIVEHR